MTQPNKPEASYQTRLRANIKRLAYWNGAWIAATALMSFGPKFLWNRALTFSLLAVALDIAVGVGMILATMKYVAELDELQRKVYLNALGVTVGVGLITGVPYSVMATYQMIPFKADIAHLVMLMAFTFLVSIVYGTWRYR
jgi:hypothetical protein